MDNQDGRQCVEHSNSANQSWCLINSKSDLKIKTQDVSQNIFSFSEKKPQCMLDKKKRGGYWNSKNTTRTSIWSPVQKSYQHITHTEWYGPYFIQFTIQFWSECNMYYSVYKTLYSVYKTKKTFRHNSSSQSMHLD